jgi:hypothetical protein
MSKQRAQGTKAESWIVTKLREAGYYAKRLAEGGTQDEGDVETIILGERTVVESKARSSLNIQEVLGNARAKAAKAAGHPVPTILVWKRLVRKPGLVNRVPVNGERVVVILSWDDFMDIINRKESDTNEK